MFKTQITKRLVIPVVLLVMSANGCSRGYYRRQADVEAQRLIQEKSTDPRWNLADGSIEIDPQSRMFNPFSQDHPPIPPDDPASHELMHCVDGKPGYPQWHANGDTDYVENPEWRSYLPINENGEVVIDIDGAFRLAMINSPELQRQKETLYLSALDVSLERFGFDTQMFAGFNSFLTTQGRFRNGSSSSTLSQGTNVDFERLGITGTNFIVGLANSIMWNFSGNNTQSASTLIDFSLIQPLLRNAGRDVVLESLTQAERTLLANVRQFDRFQRGFYLNVVIGRNPGSGPNFTGNFLGFPSAGGDNPGGYFGLLTQQQLIKIQEFNLTQLKGELSKFREFFLRERVNSLQLRQFENSVLTQQQNLIRLKNNYQNSLDSFKATLGIPPDVNVVISDPTLDQFELISDDMLQRQNDLVILKDTTGQALIEIGSLIPTAERPAENPNWLDEVEKKTTLLDANLTSALQELELVVTQDIEEIKIDLEKLKEVRPRRMQYLKDLGDSIASGDVVADVEMALFDPETVRATEDLLPLLAAVEAKLENHKKAFEELIATIADFPQRRRDFGDDDALMTYLRTEILESIPEQLTEFGNTVLELSLLQATARGNAVEVPGVKLDSELAFQIARCFRRDWMNARASVVDEWRQIEVVADRLEGQFDLVLEGDLGNVGDNPFKLRYETGQLRGGFRIDAPIVRLAERNVYRETLIRYQQTKRDYYQFEDEIQRNLRQILRNLTTNKLLYEVNRKAIQISIEEVELARYRLEEPARPGATRSTVGDTGARDITDALNRLQNAQRNFLDTWVSYEVLRRNLDFDLGTMQVDSMGNWIDPGTIDGTIAERTAAALGITLDEQFCCCLRLLQDQRLVNNVSTDLDGQTMPAEPLNADVSGDEQQDNEYYQQPDLQTPNPAQQPPFENAPNQQPAKKPDVKTPGISAVPNSVQMVSLNLPLNSVSVSNLDSASSENGLDEFEFFFKPIPKIDLATSPGLPNRESGRLSGLPSSSMSLPNLRVPDVTNSGEPRPDGSPRPIFRGPLDKLLKSSENPDF